MAQCGNFLGPLNDRAANLALHAVSHTGLGAGRGVTGDGHRGVLQLGQFLHILIAADCAVPDHAAGLQAVLPAGNLFQLVRCQSGLLSAGALVPVVCLVVLPDTLVIDMGVLTVAALGSIDDRSVQQGGIVATDVNGVPLFIGTIVVNSCECGTSIESIVTNRSQTLRQGHTHKSHTVTQSVCTKGCNTTQVSSFQRGTTVERSPPNLGTTLWQSDALQCCATTESVCTYSRNIISKGNRF